MVETKQLVYNPTGKIILARLSKHTREFRHAQSFFNRKSTGSRIKKTGEHRGQGFRPNKWESIKGFEQMISIF